MKTFTPWLFTPLLALATGCELPESPAPASALAAGAAVARCLDGAAPGPAPARAWDNPRSALVAAGLPGHSAQDVIAVAGEAAVIAGKFAYGALSMDLEGERIEVWMDDCSGGHVLLDTATTDDDGRISVSLSAGRVPPPGAYGLYLRVAGDGSAAEAVLRVHRPGTQFMVFDIDGTLTWHDGELFSELLAGLIGGSYVPRPRPGAIELTQLRSREQGYELIYLTGRPYLLTDITRRWLRQLGFAPGTVHVVDAVHDAMPTEAAVGTYKAVYLRGLGERRFVLHSAYGNATTDIHAYEQAGIAKSRTFIVGPHGGERDTVDLGDSYLPHLDSAAREPAADQPL
jgi:hypothetical protein